MFGDCGGLLRCLPCFFSVGDSLGEPDPGLDAVLLVTGMGGSILNAKKKIVSESSTSCGCGSRSSSPTLSSGATSGPSYVESLDPNVEIVVPEDDHGLYALDILDPSLIIVTSFTSLVHKNFSLQNHLVNLQYIDNMSWLRISPDSEEVSLNKQLAYQVDLFLSVHPYGLVSGAISEKFDSLRKGKSEVIEKNHTLILGWSDKLVHCDATIAFPLLEAGTFAKEMEKTNRINANGVKN